MMLPEGSLLRIMLFQRTVLRSEKMAKSNNDRPARRRSCLMRLVPCRGHLQAKARLFASIVLEVVLTAYIASQPDRLDDMKGVQYATFHLSWDITILAGPVVILIILAPVILLSSSIYARWAGIILAIWPAYLALLLWSVF